MGHERWIRGQHDGEDRPFDWLVPAEQQGIPEVVARALYEQALEQARGAAPDRVEELYLDLLADSRRDGLRPSPGKVTRTMGMEAKRSGKKRRTTRVSRLPRQPIAPGQMTLTSYLARPARDERVRDRAPGGERRYLEMKRKVLQPPSVSTRYAAGELERALGALLGTGTAMSEEAWPDEAVMAERMGEHLPEATRARMERAFAQDMGEVVIYPDSPEATGATRALTRGNEIHFRSGAYEPGTAAGDRLIAHELAHVVQQTARPAQSAGRRALEAEADLAASAVLAGRSAEVSLGASMGAALAFSDSEDHDVDADDKDTAATAAPAADATASTDAAASTDTAASTDAESSVPALETGADTEAEADDGNDAALLAEIRSPVPVEAGSAGSAVDSAAGAAGSAAGAAGNAGGAAAAFSMKANAPGDVLASLRDAPASRALDALGQAQSLLPGVLSKQRETAQEALPKIETPTGLPPRGASEPAAKPSALAGGAAVSPAGDQPTPVEGGVQETSPEAIVPEAPPAPTLAPTQLAGRDDSAAEEGQNDPALARSAQQALASVGAPVDRVSTRVEDTPRVDLSGEADPAQLQSSLQGSQQQTAEARGQAAAETHQDFGEHDIFPEPDDEILEAQTQLSEHELAGIEEAGGRAVLPAEAMASIDAEASPILQERIGKEQARYAEGEQQYETDSQAAHDQTRDDIQTLEADTRTQQEQAQASAREEVTGARQDWQHEIDDVQSEFQTKADDARSEHQQQIQTKEKSGNLEATRHIADAEQKAELEKRKARDEVARAKESKSKESKGFWGWVKSKAKALVDGLKKAVSFIYDNLRKAVLALFEAAKRLALAAIELARKAIVGLIKAYGAILKGLVRIALAAFPEIRDRIQRRIDQAVSAATDLVNEAADALKKGVSTILDFLASTIDKILGLIQDLYNAVFTIIGMIISGELKEIIARLGNLIDAAKTAPGQFETAAYEELLGGNLDQPLSPAELMAAGRTPPASAASPGLAGGMHTEQGEVDGETHLPGPPWTEENVGVDAVVSGEELSPELSEQLLEMTGGSDGEVTFGESGDASRSLESILGMQAQGQTLAQGAQDQAVAGQAAYSDGLTPRERAVVKWEAMKKGLAEWWSQNWPYVLAGGVLAAAGFIVANILTGGAILAALPAIMSAVGYIFAGLMVVQLAAHLRDFLQKGWNGDIQGGGKSLAKGLAAGAIELITMLTFKVGSVALKGAKAAAKGVVKGAQAVARGTATVAKGAMAIARRGAQYMLKGGKVLLRGAGQGISRGVKRLRDLGARLLQRTRFKGFRIRIQRRRFVLEGKINPWVKVMEGNLVEVAEGTPGANWIDDDLWATGRLQRKFSKPRKSLSEADEAARAKDALRQSYEVRTEKNTRQREQARNDRGAAIETLEQTDQPLENTTRRRAGHGHGHRDHGYQTRLVDHRARIETGNSPSGRRGRSGNPPRSSAKFYSPEAEMEALQKAEQELQKALQRGYPKLRDGEQPNRFNAIVETDHPRGFGGGYKAKLDPSGSPSIDPGSGRPLVEPVKKIKKASVTFEYLPSNDTWVPVTYYPQIRF